MEFGFCSRAMRGLYDKITDENMRGHYFQILSRRGAKTQRREVVV